MKNFFKKLSFVMALAMIISVIAPAAGAFAASAPALTAKGTKYLQLGDATKGTLDINVTNKPAGAKYAWKSSETKVATVDKYGVVKSKKIGTTTISLAITKKDGKTSTLSVKVVVRDNIASFDSIVAKDGADLTKLVAGKEYDLDGKYTTASGAKSGTSSTARWFVNSDKATIDVKSGLFKATEGGEYEVTVYAFQTANGYAAWSALNDKTSTLNVLTKNTFKVTVLPSVVSTAQVSKDTFKVTFDTDISKSTFATDLVVYQVIDSKDVTTGAEKVKEVKFDATGKVATVVMYAPFTAKSDYKFVSGTFTGTFKAASASLEDVAGIVFEDVNVDTENLAGTSLLGKVYAVNKDGVKILDGDAIASNLEFTFNGDATKGFVSDSTAYIYELNYKTTITAKYTNFIYSDAEKKYVEVKFEATAVAVGSKTDKSVVSSSLQYLVKAGALTSDDKNSTTAWSSSTTVAANDGAFTIYARYKAANDSSTTLYAGDAGAATLTYTSGDSDKLVINGTSMVPIAQGKVTVIVKNGDTVVGAFDVVILADRTFKAVTQDLFSAAVGNNAINGEDATIKFKAIDSLNSTISTAAFVGASTRVVNGPSGYVLSDLDFTYGTIDSDGNLALTVSAKEAVVGAYNIEVTLQGFNSNDKKTANFTLIVKDSNSTNGKVIAKYAPVVTKGSVDLKKVTGVETSTVEVYALNAAGLRVEKLLASEFDVTVKLGSSTYSKVLGDVVTLVSKNATTNVLEMPNTGTYTVSATWSATNTLNRPTGLVIGYSQITVTDTNAYSVAITKSTVKVGAPILSLGDVIDNAFEIKLNGTEINYTTTTNIDVNYVITNGTAKLTSTASTATTGLVSGTLYVDSVEYKVTDAGTSTVYVYTIPVKKTIVLQ